MARKHPGAAQPRTRRNATEGLSSRRPPFKKVIACQPFAQILVRALAPGTQPGGVTCTSSADFLVYCSTNYFGPGGAPPSWGYAVGVKSTASALGSASPVFIVGGVANDVVTITMQPGTTGFITLQTQCNAKASITFT
jgi:hypothetical protein